MKLNHQIDLFIQENYDLTYQKFLKKIVSSNYPILGVRAPLLKKYAKEITRDNPKWFYEETFDTYEKARTRMGLPLTEYPEAHSHLLGYADLIQNEMCTQCELVQRGYYLGKGWPELDADEQAQLEKDRTEWTLLLQLGTVPYGKKDEWLWGDCGCIYFYIRKSDLAARRFDRVWLILQCG